MPVRSAAPSHAPRQAQGSRLSDDVRVRAALDWFTPNISWVNDQQARITEIPAPAFQEAQRAAAVKELLAESGLPAHIDKTGNVIGELRGVNEKEIVVIAAHLDTVFPPGTDVKVHRDGSRMTAPGISDNGSGVAALLALARAVQFAHLKPQRTVLFVGDVGEEGEGNLRGMRADCGYLPHETQSRCGARRLRHRSRDDESPRFAPPRSSDHRPWRPQLVRLRHAQSHQRSCPWLRALHQH